MPMLLQLRPQLRYTLRDIILGLCAIEQLRSAHVQPFILNLRYWSA